jgi:hypothetical protein
MKSRNSLAALAFVLFPALAPAASVTLTGFRSPDDSALVSGMSLTGNTYSFTIQNTAPAGVIANLGLNFGNTLRLLSFTTSAPFQYNIQNSIVAGDFNYPLDFAMIGDQTKGLAPGESETYTWTLGAAGGGPFPAISAADIAAHQVIRFRLLPTASGTDLAAGPNAAIPEPATVSVVSLAFLGMVLVRRSTSCRVD